MQQSLQTLKSRPFLLLAVGALLVAATRGSLGSAVVLTLGVSTGAAVGGWIPPAKTSPKPLSIIVFLAGLFAATILTIYYSSAKTFYAFLAICGAIVGVALRASPRNKHQGSFGLREAFILLGGAGALLGSTIARDYLLPLTFIPLSIAIAFSIATRGRDSQQ